MWMEHPGMKDTQSSVVVFPVFPHDGLQFMKSCDLDILTAENPCRREGRRETHRIFLVFAFPSWTWLNSRGVRSHQLSLIGDIFLPVHHIHMQHILWHLLNHDRQEVDRTSLENWRLFSNLTERHISDHSEVGDPRWPPSSPPFNFHNLCASTRITGMRHLGYFIGQWRLHFSNKLPV